MKNLISELETKDTNFKNFITSLTFYKELLQKFQAEPDNTIRAIAEGKVLKNSESKDLESEVELLKKEFEDLKKGLEGEFTRSTSVELAKTKLLTSLEKCLTSFSESYVDLSNIITVPKEELQKSYELVHTNIDMNTLQARKERYHRSKLERDYMLKTIVKILSTKLVNSNIQACAKGFLQKILEVMAKIRIFEFDNIDKNVNIYHHRCFSINSNFKSIGTDETFDATKATPLNTLEDATGEQEFNNMLTSMKIEEDKEKDEVVLLDIVIDDLAVTDIQINKNIDKLVKVYENFRPSEFNTKYYVDTIIEKFVTPYTKLELTDEKFFKSLEDSVIILENSNLNEIDLIKLFGNVLVKLNNYVYIFNYIYGACEECSVSGTIISSGVVKDINKK